MIKYLNKPQVGVGCRVWGFDSTPQDADDKTESKSVVEQQKPLQIDLGQGVVDEAESAVPQEKWRIDSGHCYLSDKPMGSPLFLEYNSVGKAVEKTWPDLQGGSVDPYFAHILPALCMNKFMHQFSLLPHIRECKLLVDAMRLYKGV